MRRFSIAIPDWWRDPAFKACSDDAKLLYIFLSQAPHMMMTGVGYLPIPTGAFELGWPAEKYERAFRELLEKGLVAYDSTTCEIFILNFEYGYALNPKHYQGVRKAADAIRSEALKKSALELAEKRRSRLTALA